MAFQYWQIRGHAKKCKFLALSEAYHGDTLGSVSVGGIDLFHRIFHSRLINVIGGLLLEGVYWLLRAAPALWWLYAGGVMLLFTVVLSSLSPLLILPLFFKFTPLDDDA